MTVGFYVRVDLRRVSARDGRRAGIDGKWQGGGSKRRRVIDNSGGGGGDGMCMRVHACAEGGKEKHKTHPSYPTVA